MSLKGENREEKDFMTHEEFVQIAKMAVGTHPKDPNKLVHGGQKELAKMTGVSQPMISLIYSDPDRTISTNIAEAMYDLARDIASGNLAPKTGGSINPSKIISSQELNAEVQVAQERAAEAVKLANRDPDEGRSDNDIIEEMRMIQQSYENVLRHAMTGKRHAITVTGPPGIGKSHTVFMIAEELGLDVNNEKEVRFRSGGTSTIGMYKDAYELANGGLLIYDDCDDVFSDLPSLNMLKGLIDTKEARMVSWAKESRALVDEMGEKIPKSFEFRGRIIFLSNLDVQREIEKEGPRSKHFAAVKDRSGLLSLGISSKRRKVLKVLQVCQDSKLMENAGISDPSMKQKMMDFFKEHQNDWSLISLRLMTLLCKDASHMNWDEFRRQAAMTYMRPDALHKMLREEIDKKKKSQEEAA